jgi:hypothetical protein
VAARSDSELTLLVTARDGTTVIQQALRDWVIAGVAKSHAVLRTHELGDAACHHVSSAGIEVTSVQDLLAQERPRRARVVVLHELLPDRPPLPFDAVTELLDRLTSAAGTECAWTRCVLHISGPGAAPAPEAHDGWHNIVISPEDSHAPGEPLVVVDRGPTGSKHAVYATAAVAAISGLLTGQKGAPIDDWPVAPGQHVIVARAFSRRLDAADLELQLRRTTQNLSGGLPRVTGDGVAFMHHPDPARAANEMAKAFWTQNRHLFEGPRDTTEPPARRPIRVVEALREFAGYMVAALRAAPAAWARGLLESSKATLAAGVESLVFGEDSVYLVTFGGRSPEGGVASKDQTWHALDQVNERLRLVASDHRTADLSSLWRQFIDGALTLGDGQTRGEGLRAPHSAGTPAVVRTPSHIAPPVGQYFHISDGSLAAQLPVTRALAGDVMESSVLDRALGSLESDARLGVAASRELETLHEWTQQQTDSYTAFVLGHIAAEIEARSEEAGALRAVLTRAVASETPSAAAVKKQRRVARVVALILAVTVVLVVSLVVTGVAALLTWSLVALLSLPIVITGLGAAFVTFYRGERDLFQRLHARKTAISEAPAAERNLVQVLREAQHLATTYRVGLAWAQVIGAFLHRPLPPSGEATEPSKTLAGPAPRAMSFGVARSSKTEMARVAHLLRQRTFRVGWLSQPWQSFLSSLTTQLGASAAGFGERSLLELDPEDSVNLLGAWSSTLTIEGNRSTAADELWVKSQSLLQNGDPAVSFLTTVAVATGAGRVEEMPMHDFRSAVEPVDRGDTALATAVFSPTAIALGLNRVLPKYDWADFSQVGLGCLAVLVQRTEALPPSALDRTVRQDDHRPEGGVTDQDFRF